MDYLKEFFEAEGAEKSFDAFQKWCKEKGYKLANLSSGEYESKAKAERLIAEKEAAVKAEYEAKLKAAQEEMDKIKAEIESKSSTLTESEKEKQEKEKKLKELEDKWEKANKKHEDAIKKLEEEANAAKAASLLAERKSLYIQAGGKQKNLDRDISYLSNLVNEENSFEAVLENYKTDNPDVFASDKPAQGSTSTIPPLAGGQNATDTQALVDQERQRIGLPPKYGGDKK